MAEGYREAGYQYVALDDCWQAPHRVDGHIVSHPQRFPSGIKALGEPHSPAAPQPCAAFASYVWAVSACKAEGEAAAPPMQLLTSMPEV
eukprot:COSAG01_NODE_2930_length_6835_cov_82.625891_3_plen_89_part_00